MADNKKSVNLLPEYLKSDKNSKFLSGTLDPLIQTPQLERIDGFVGSVVTPNYNPDTDFYIKEDLPLRKEYALEPALVFKDQSSNITDVIGFDDIINEMNLQGGKTNDLDRLFRSKFYSYDPQVNWDKLVNYNQYYWLPNGPNSILVDDDINIDVDIVGQISYTMDNGYPLSNGMKLKFASTSTIYNDEEFYVEGVGKGIKLINVKLLEVNEPVATVYNERFDSELFDSYSFDSSKRLPITPEYITINRASADLNPWTRYNRWFHSEILRITADINNIASVVYPLDSRAKRPIIEFNPGMQLYNFGKVGIKNVDVIDVDTVNALDTINGTIGYYSDGVLLEHGTRVIFNADGALAGRIYTVEYDVSTNPATIILVEDYSPDHLDSVAVNFGDTNKGTSWHYNAATDSWIKSQERTTLNQAPLFDLYDANGVSYGNRAPGSSSFTGSKIFGYEIGSVYDKVLGFNIKYKNSIGVGSYVFKNYFMSDSINVTNSNNVSSVISSGITYFKIDEEYFNVWQSTEDYKTPIIEVQTITTQSQSLKLTSISTTATSVFVNLNGSPVNSTLGADGITVNINTATSLAVNDVVSLEIITDGIPNSNGFYKTPLGLTNNPLNGPITEMTLTELSDHLLTMVNRTSGFSGDMPGVSNIRDLNDYSKYGTRLIINYNPIAFAQIFLGKKEHNVVDSIRYSADQYNQFKMNMLRHMVDIDSQLSAPDALDVILTKINSGSEIHSPYYRSDMLGYGGNKIVRESTATNSNVFSMGVEFDLSALSFESVLVYLNGTQLISNKDYTFDKIDSLVMINSGVTVGDTVAIHYYTDTRGAYIPPTPSKLGLYPTFEPQLYTTYSNDYINEVTLIQGHDGSLMNAYGDYRDDIILEYEKRVFNNIKIAYNPDIFDVRNFMPGAFRENKYLLSDVNGILAKDFIKWTGQYNIDVTSNSTYDEGNPFTWNYSKFTDTVFNKSVPGYWRGIYKYFYDTDRPHSHPWEMLGFTIMPTWWEDVYGSAPYASDNTNLWEDLETGTVSDPSGSYILTKYARPGLVNIIPTDIDGNLKEPYPFLIDMFNPTDAQSSWIFGDHGPAESAWRNSSYWPFVTNVLSALLDPCSYSSTMFDTSRMSVNNIGQITYNSSTTDDIYLNPSKLLLDGTIQASGFGIYVIERGKNKNTNYVSILQRDLTYINFNLFHKLGGFASKDKLQIVIDSIDPVSQAQGALLPPEDYSLILNVSNPIKSASISGVIVQRAGSTLVVKGYDTTNPYFKILRPLKTSSSGSLTVGGKSESFTEWSGITNNGNSGLSSIDLTSTSANTTRYYKAGQIVRYNGSFYIVIAGHNAQSTFDLKLFQKLPTLPMTGGASVQLSSAFENAVTTVPYGTTYSTIQEVYDMLIGYGAYLESQGFIFDEYNSELNDVVNWKFTGREFLYWTTQNWADGNLITLSPFADYLKYSYLDSVVDNVSSGDYEFSLLKADGKSFPRDKFRLSREDGVCIINTIDTLDGLFFATLNSVQKEHGMVFNNSTIFNDTIYDIETGYKQRRIKLSGFRTKNWNGDYFSPGFVYDDVIIIDWIAYGNYLPGKLVRYNGSYYESAVKITGDAVFDFAKWVRLDNKPVSNLLPNFDYKINQFEDFYSLDIDNFDSTQQQLAQHLIGYTPRPYLNNVFTNPISQYKFYQGYIREKGTKNSIDKLAKVGKFTRQGSISFNEDWAFRVGNYGSYSTYNEIEFTLEESTTLENPYLIKFVNSTPAGANPLVNYINSSDLLLTPTDYNSAKVFPTLTSTFDDNNFILTTAGYARADDVTATAYNKNSLLDIANNSLLQEGNTIWMGFLENGDWGIKRYANQPAKIAGVYISSPGIDITFTTDINHNLSVGDIISVVRFDDQVNGIHIVTGIPRLDQFTVASSLTSITNSNLLSYGALFKFENARYGNIQEIANSKDILKLKEGDKIWLDRGIDDKWQVYQKVKNYSTGTSNLKTLSAPLNQRLGQSIYTSDDTDILMVSVPGWTVKNTPGIGGVWVYTKHNITGTLDKRFEFALNTTQYIYCESGTDTEFGSSLAFDINKNLYFASAPAASNVKVDSASRHGVVILSTGTGYTKNFASEGVVKIIATDSYLTRETTSTVLVNPYSTTTNIASHSRFGHSIYINQPSSTTSTTLLVGAPGDSINTGTGKVYAYSVKSISTITAHASGINLNSHVALTFGSQFGYKIAGDTTGTIIAISAPYHVVNTSTIGVVQIFTGPDLTWAQTLTSPFGTSNSFGTDVAVSPDGTYIFVSSVESKVVGESFGHVAVYKKSGTQFVLLQIIKNPSYYNDLKFGYSISISKDNGTLVVSALGTNSSEITTFDGTMVFDGGTTRFTNPLLNAGTVYSYNNLDGYFIYSEEIFNSSIIEGSKYGASIVATNDDVYIGAPTYYESSGVDESKLYHFSKIDSTINGSLLLLREQDNSVDVSTIDRIALIDSFKEEIIDYLDVIDPLKGKIAGIAEQELKYKSASDPATYTIGLASAIIDADTSWIDDHVGELWWDLSTVKYQWYEQGDDIFRKNNWGKLFPGSSIDVYEWVRSDLLPSEWAAQSDTNDGLTKGISGQPKYPDNSIVSVKQIFNNVTNSFENVYFFWVKNKVTIPSVKNRRISGYQVSNIISDPTANGLKFAEFLSANSIALANVQPMLVGSRISANIAIDSTSNNIPRHTEWILLSEGSANSNPTELLNKKLVDSLLGHDQLGNAVPDPILTYRNRYGIGIRPQQTLFKDRIGALRNVVEFANSVLIKNIITGNYSFDNLNKVDPTPDIYTREYDSIVEDQSVLEAISFSTTVKYSQAELECFTNNGKIVRVDIISSGYGYTNPPKVTILSDNLTAAEILTEIDVNGRVVNVVISSAGSGFVSAPLLVVRPHTIIVQANSTYNGIWTKHQYNYSLSAESNTPVWYQIKNQTYNTTLFWNYADWNSDNYNTFKDYAYVINDVYELSTLIDVLPGDYVKIKDNGQGRYIIIEKMSDTEYGNYSKDYSIVFSENGTIQIKDSIWDYAKLNYSYDNATLDETLYDQIPDLELFYVLTALKDDIFINDLKSNWNLLFFTAVKYALTEQKLLDWAFKTSFINVINVIGSLDQRPVYKLDEEQNFEDYIKEVKPYHSQIRTYTSNYSYLEDSNERLPLSTTDFDLPSYFNTLTDHFDVVNFNTSTNALTGQIELSDKLFAQQPWKSWADNYTSEIGSIIVIDSGSGYTQRPTVTITGGGPFVTATATAEAYIRSGGIYQILVTNPGAGYTINPTVTITGGGQYVTSTTTASATLLNLKTRKNIIGMKFDRVNPRSEIGDSRVVDTFVCSGKEDKFVLTWLANPDKLKISPTLDGKLILGSDYTLVYYTEESNGYSKKYSKFVFLNYIPSAEQVFRISYEKSIELYTAVDRIEKLHTSTDTLSSLMEGIVYPGSVIQGLPFDYSVAWDTVSGKGRYDVDGSTWSELVNYYTTAKLVGTATIGTTTLSLNTTTGVVSGQVINILNSSTIRVRADTVVTSVNTTSRTITISQPFFRIKSAKSTSTIVGAEITVKTINSFNGGIAAGDQISVTGITSSGYNDSYIIDRILDADQFVIKALSILSTSTAIATPASSATVISIISTIDANDVLLGHFTQRYDISNQTLSVQLDIAYDDISKINIRKDFSGFMLPGIPITGPYPGAEYYHMTDTGTDGKAVISFYQMTNSSYTLEFFVYGHPTIEFWKPETLVSGLDSSIPGGSWSSGNFVGGQGVTFTSTSILSTTTGNIIDGDAFLNVRSGYAPEELVAGHVLDSLGVNVYTKSDNSYANVTTGVIPIANLYAVTTATLSMMPGNYDGVMLYYNGALFNRLTDDEIALGKYYLTDTATPAGPIGTYDNSSNGDDTYTLLALPFDWYMFNSDIEDAVGNVFNQVYVSSNGYLAFGLDLRAGESLITSTSRPISLYTIDVPTIYVEFCDLWQDYGNANDGTTPLSNSGSPGLYTSSGSIGSFQYWKLRYQGTHFNYKDDTPTVPEIDFEVTLFTNGQDQYVEMIFGTTFKEQNPSGPFGFACGIAGPHGERAASLSYTDIEDNSSHVFYGSIANGPEWVYLGPGKFNQIRTPFFGYSSTNQYFIEDNTITIAPQQMTGNAVITMVGIGGDRSVIDSNLVVAINTSTVIVESLASINDIRSAYVTVNGSPINPVTSTLSYGYMLTSVSDNNKRACVKVYGLNSLNPHTVEAWFFESSYTKFNRIHEEIFYVTREFPEGGPPTPLQITLSNVPGVVEPASDQIIVTYTDRTQNVRLKPPITSYYKIRNNQLTFDVDSQRQYPQYWFAPEDVKVYANGVELRPGFDYTLDPVLSTITITPNLLQIGDVIAIESIHDTQQDFILSGNILELQNFFYESALNAIVRVISFTDHDNMMIRTERFTSNMYHKYNLAFPVPNENYVWIYANGRYLIPKYEYELLDNMTTIELSPRVFASVDAGGQLVVTTINPKSYGTNVLGYRVFNDMFDRHEFKRISSFYSTTLSQPLHITDTEIYVTDASKLIPPNPLTNRPGVVIIDGERIEFFVKDGNILRQLRRSTLGTGPAEISHAGTTVIDQSLQQEIPYTESVLVQTTSTTELSYVINTVTNTVTGDGIILTSGIAAADQVTVYYGGRQLRKTPLELHDKSKSYDDSPASTTILPPEFSIDILPLPVLVTEMVTGGRAPTGSGWVFHETAETMQIQPGWIMTDANGYRYTVISSGHNTLFNGWGVGFASAITITWPLTFTGPTRQQLTLNISDTPAYDTNLTIVQRKGYVWTGTESLLTSNVTQAHFLQEKEADLPNIYYYGG